MAQSYHDPAIVAAASEGNMTFIHFCRNEEKDIALDSEEKYFKLQFFETIRFHI